MQFQALEETSRAGWGYKYKYQKAWSQVREKKHYFEIPKEICFIGEKKPKTFL